MSQTRGKLVVISSPSGGGKTTVTSRLLKRREGVLARVVTATTRECRPGEVEGRDYYFLSEEAFEKKIKTNGFLEWAEVHGKRYGTPRDEVARLRDAGKTVILVIDVQGAASVRRIEKDAITIFILPPGDTLEEQKEVLRMRLEKRAQDSGAEIIKRLKNASQEILRKSEFEYKIQNIDLDETVNKVEEVIFS